LPFATMARATDSSSLRFMIHTSNRTNRSNSGSGPSRHSLVKLLSPKGA
jgi:hypothetical protein